MDERQWRRGKGLIANTLKALAALALGSCGGGTGTLSDSGSNKTYLSVQASDADGDALHYQWRATGGTIENRDSNQTVWTMPDGPGLHFAYVTVSDGKGGYAQQQYAVSSDSLGTDAPTRAAITNPVPPVSDFDGDPTTGVAGRLRFVPPDSNLNLFTPFGGGPTSQRFIYLPDVQVAVENGGTTVFSGSTDLSGELSLPKLANGTYTLKCSTSSSAPLADCGSYSVNVDGGAAVSVQSPPLANSGNLRVFGHIGLADGGVCGTQNEYFNLQSAATVQVLLSDGQALSAPQRVNRFGDYAVDTNAPVNGTLQLKVVCEAFSQLVDVPPPGAAGYVASNPVQVPPILIPNSRPSIVKMVANGPDGNVRGQMVELELPGAQSLGLPGGNHFLTYKGGDTRLSACSYYRSLGAVGDCDSQGNLINPISFDDWKRQRHFAPYNGTNTEWSATYINKMDLNLVRRMVATNSSPNASIPSDISFYVCNHPGPNGSSQQEVDDVLATGLADQKKVACVAMEWSVTPNVNNGRPFTKFLTFAPDGSLLPSVNLDGRGEKYMPGACVACHGGGQYNGRFAQFGNAPSSNPSPYLGSGFLPFDTGNYLFGSRSDLTEQAQSEAIYQLNQLVKDTESSKPKGDNATSSTTQLINNWYLSGHTLDRQYLPQAWTALPAGQYNPDDIALFYRQVVGSSCRTCHTSLRPQFDWDSNPSTLLNPNPAINLDPTSTTYRHFCGGGPDIAKNASMPNALISRDRVSERANADPHLATLLTQFLGCSAPVPDPAYPAR